MIWQMMMAMLHSNGQLRTEGWRQRKDAKNLLYSRRLLIMMMQHSIHCVYIKASRFYVNFNSYTKYSYTWLCFFVGTVYMTIVIFVSRYSISCDRDIY